MRSFAFSGIAAAALIAARPDTALAHPIHMSFTEIRFVESRKSFELSVRVFANDFSAAAARYSRTRLGADSLIDAGRGLSYLLAKIRVAAGGAPIVLTSCGVGRAGDMLRFCLRTEPMTGTHPIYIANSVMTELFHDQVNVVQSSVGRKRASRMFVRGDGWKPVR